MSEWRRRPERRRGDAFAAGWSAAIIVCWLFLGLTLSWWVLALVVLFFLHDSYTALRNWVEDK